MSACLAPDPEVVRDEDECVGRVDDRVFESGQVGHVDGGEKEWSVVSSEHRELVELVFMGGCGQGHVRVCPWWVTALQLAFCLHQIHPSAWSQ